MLHLPACGCILVSVFSPVNPNSLTGKHAIEPAPEKDRMGLDDKVPHEKGTVTESTVATRSGGQGLGRHERFGEETGGLVDCKYVGKYRMARASGDPGCCVYHGNVPFMKSCCTKTP